MPRFYFDIADDRAMTPDEEGLDLPDLERAKREAVAALRDLARESPPAERAPWSVTSTIRTEGGQAVFQATLSFQSRDLS